MKSEGKLEQSNYHHICKFAIRLNCRNNRARGQQKCSDPNSLTPNGQCIHDNDDDAVTHNCMSIINYAKNA